MSDVQEKKAQKRWSDTNPVAAKAYKEKYYVEHRDIFLARCLKSRYGMTTEQQQALLETQGGKCASCGDDFFKTPHVDHDHSTGKIRGLLCRECNIAAGYLKDDPARVMDLAAYLVKHKS